MTSKQKALLLLDLVSLFAASMVLLTRYRQFREGQ